MNTAANNSRPVAIRLACLVRSTGPGALSCERAWSLDHEKHYNSDDIEIAKAEAVKERAACCQNLIPGKVYKIRLYFVSGLDYEVTRYADRDYERILAKAGYYSC